MLMRHSLFYMSFLLPTAFVSYVVLHFSALSPLLLCHSLHSMSPIYAYICVINVSTLSLLCAIHCTTCICLFSCLLLLCHSLFSISLPSSHWVSLPLPTNTHVLVFNYSWPFVVNHVCFKLPTLVPTPSTDKDIPPTLPHTHFYFNLYLFGTQSLFSMSVLPNAFEFFIVPLYTFWL